MASLTIGMLYRAVYLRGGGRDVSVNGVRPGWWWWCRVPKGGVSGGDVGVGVGVGESEGVGWCGCWCWWVV